MRNSGRLLALAGIMSLPVWAAGFGTLAGSVQEFELGNGLRVAVMERRQSPIVSVQLRVGSGLVDDPAGKAGLARVIAGTYWQGGENSGSRNPAAEKAALSRVDEWLDERDQELRKGEKANLLTAEDYRLKAAVASDTADTLGTNLYVRNILVGNGGSALIAEAMADSMRFGATLPASRVELWLKLTADWLRRPSHRFFYKDRNRLSVYLERQSLTEIDAKWPKLLIAGALAGSPYERLTAPAAELQTVRTADMEKFFARHMVARNLTLAVVGDISAAEVRRLAELYFGPVAPGAPAPSAGEEKARKPVPADQRKLRVEDDNEAIWVAAWPRPPRSSPDRAALELLTAVLAGSRSSALHSELVNEEQVIIQARSSPTFPGDRYLGLFTVQVIPAPGRDFTDVEKAVLAKIEEVRTKPISVERLTQARNWLYSMLLNEELTSAGMAEQLARARTEFGTVRAFYQFVDGIKDLTPAVIQQAAAKYLREEDRIIVSGGETRMMIGGSSR